MLAVERKLIVICIYIITLSSLIGCREISTSRTDYNGVSTTKRITSSGDLGNDEVENSNLESGYNELRLENVERGIVRQDNDDERRSGTEFPDNKTIFMDDRKKLLTANRKGKIHKKILRSEKKLEKKILQKNNGESSPLSNRLEKRSVRSVNSSDYYAQRKAIMDKFYMRQKKIATKYSKERNDVDIDASRNVSTGNWERKYTLNIHQVHLDKDNRALKANDDVDNPTTKTLNSRAEGTAIRDITNYSLPANRNCTNVTLSGDLPRKSHKKQTLSFNDHREDENEIIIDQKKESTSLRPNRQDTTDSNVDQRWGSCDGSLVYQHNLLLGLKGPSNLDAAFKVVIEGPICITCVEVLRYNQTRALVTLDSGGRGYDYIKLKLTGYKNEGFSYIVKVWGVKKTGDDCASQL